MARTVKTIDSEEKRGRRGADKCAQEWAEWNHAPANWLKLNLSTARLLATSPCKSELERAFHRGFVEQLERIISESDGVVELFS